MPEPLISATIDLHAERIDRQTWVRLIAARRGYRLMPKQNADADGYPRVMCPAEAARPSAPSSPAPWAAASISPLENGGPEWQKIYFRLRNSVEGYNGYAKNPLAEGIEAAGSRRIRGIAAQTILLAFQLAQDREVA
nr:hypothetical protein OH837_22780 [Streptomyces canus]